MYYILEIIVKGSTCFFYVSSALNEIFKCVYVIFCTTLISTVSLSNLFFAATPRDSKGRSISLSGSSGNLSSTWQSTDISTNSSGQAVIKTKLQLVDLAGSECVGMYLNFSTLNSFTLLDVFFIFQNYGGFNVLDYPF